MKKIYLIFISVLIIISFWLGMKAECELVSWEKIGKPITKKKQIYFPNKNTSLYLKSKNWGLTYDHKIIVISTNSKLEFTTDTISDYIFHGFAGIIYKTENDTLKIYSHQKPKIPHKFESKINIKLIQIKNNKEWRKLKGEIEKNYQIFE